MGVIRQSEFEALLDELKVQKEKLLPGQKLSFADFLKEHGYEPTLRSINFAVENKTVNQSRMQNQDGSISTVTTVPRRTDLLIDIDFTDCDLSECRFNDCDLTGVVCTHMTIKDCSFKGAVLNQGLMSHVIIEHTEFAGTSFDYGKLDNVRFSQCRIEYSSFNYLQALKNVTIEACSMSSVVLLGGVSAENFIISAPVIPDESPQSIDDFHTDQEVVLHNVVKTNHKPTILLPWNNQVPGMSATLTEQMLLSQGMQPVRMDYKPEVDAKALDKELNELNDLTHEKMKQLKAKTMETAKKIASMKAEEREKAMDSIYSGITPMALYHILRKVTINLLSKREVSGKEISEQFEVEWTKQGISFPMLMIEIMREESTRDKNKFPQASQLYEHAKSLFGEVDGVMISGGQDIDPRFYGQKQDRAMVLESYPEHSDLIDSRRDMLELSLIYMQQRASSPKPLCGISRGSQLIAVAYGGTLYQDLKVSERQEFFLETIQTEKTTPDSPVIGNKLVLAEQDREVFDAMFFHHQGYDLSTAHGVQSRASTQISRGIFIHVVAENLPPNICIVQVHPEFQYKESTGDITSQLSSKVAESIIEQFSSRVQTYNNARKVSKELLMASIVSSGRIFLSRSETEDRTASISIPGKTKDYQTVCIGMGPVGLLTALSAIDRGEKVAILTDRAPDTGLTIRQQVLGIDDEAMMFVKKLIRPEIWRYYVKNNIVTLHPYEMPNPSKPEERISINYWYFSTGGLEKMLLEEYMARIDDRCMKLSGNKNPVEARREARSKVGIDVLVVDKIDPKLTADINLSTRSRLNDSPDEFTALLKYLRAQTLLRQKHMDIRPTEKTITVAGIKSVNGMPTPVSEQRQTFGYEHIAIANGGKQAAEKALATAFSADNVHFSQPLVSSHVAVIFNLTGTLSGFPPVNFDAHELTRQIEKAKKDKTHEPMSMAKLREYGWTDASRPHQQIYASRANNLETEFCYIGCEYPEALKVSAIRAAIELKLRDPTEYEKTVPAKIREAINRDTNKEHANVISKTLTRQWARMLFQDALPQNLCDKHIIDPTYDNPQNPIQSGQRQLETSQFDLVFSELDTTIVISGDPLQEDVGTIVSLGDGRMLPLYTTGTGFQTGAKMAMHYHNAQTEFAKGLAELRKKYHLDSEDLHEPDQTKSDHNYRSEYQDLLGEVYGKYHAEVRFEIDKIREVQAKWIEKRNERVLKAAAVFYVMQEAVGMCERVEKIAVACDSIKGNVRPGLFSAKQKDYKELIPDKALAEKLERIRNHMKKVACNLNTFYVQFNENQIVAYEGVPELVLHKQDATVQEYYSFLREACLSIKDLEHEITSCNDFCSKEATQTGMNKAIFEKLKIAAAEMQALLDCDIYRRHSADSELVLSENPFIHDAILRSEEKGMTI